MGEFSFVENESWLRSFLQQAIVYYQYTNTNITFQDVTDFAVNNVKYIFRNRCSFDLCNNDKWVRCVSKEDQNKSNSRISSGFEKRCKTTIGIEDRYVPNSKKFNPLFNDEKYNDVVLLAEYSYNYLYYHTYIETLLTTPLSDYTRFNDETKLNVLNRLYMINLREIQRSSNLTCPDERSNLLNRSICIQINDILDTYEVTNMQ